MTEKDGNKQNNKGSKESKNTDKGIEDDIEFVTQNPADHSSDNEKNKPSQIPKYISNRHKLRSILFGLVVSLVFSSIVSFIFNINLLIDKSHLIRNRADLFIVSDLMLNIFIFFLAGIFIFVPISFFMALKGKRKIWIALLLVSLGLVYLQYKKVPHLQRLIVAKSIYNDTKQVPPFVKPKWENYILQDNVKKHFNTNLKISIGVMENSIRGINNENGRKEWEIEIPDKSGGFVSQNGTVIGSSFIYSIKNRIVSRKVVSGHLDWTFRANTPGVSNFLAEKEVVSFYCKGCSFQGAPRVENINQFLSYIVFLNRNDGKLINAIKIDETSKQLRGEQIPVVHFYNNSFYAVFERLGKILLADTQKIYFFGSISEFTRPVDIKEALGIKQIGISYNEKGQRAYFEKENLFFNSHKWLRRFDIEKRKMLWTINKGFISEPTKGHQAIDIIGYSKLIVLRELGNLYAVNIDSGQIVWGPKDGGFKGPPVISGPYLFAFSSEKGGSIIVLMAGRGRYLYHWAQHKEVENFFAWNNNLIFTARDNVGVKKQFGYFFK